MKKKLLLTGYFIGVLAVAKIHASGFQQAYGNQDTRLVHFSPVRDGGFILFGNTRDSINRNSGYILEKVDSNGLPLWIRTYADTFPAFASAIDTLTDGGFVSIGSHETVSFSSLAEVIRYDSTGARITSNVYPPPGGWGTYGVGILSNPDNTLITNVYYDGFISDNYYYVSKLQQNLTQTWNNQTATDGSYMSSQSIARDNSGGYWVMVFYDFSFTGGNPLQLTNLIHYNTSGTETYDSLFSLGYRPTCIASTDDGGCVISGFEDDQNSGQHLLFTRLNASGIILWQKEIRTPSTRSVGSFIVQTSDGGFAAAAAIADTLLTVKRNILLYKMDASGDSVWIRTLGSTGDDYPIMLRTTTDQGLAILNVTDGYGTARSLLIKTDSIGQIDLNYRITGTTHYLCNGDSTYLSIVPLPAITSQVLWSTGETGDSILVNTSGLFSATITDSLGQLSTAEMFDVLVAPVPSVHFSDDTVRVCEGTEIVPANLEQDISLTFQWSVNEVPQAGGEGDSIEAIITGWYELTASNYCGTSADSVYVSQINSLPFVEPISSGGIDAICPGDSLLLLAGNTGFISYQWNLQENFDPVPIPNATDTFFYANTEGFYQVEVTDSNGCHNFSDPFPLFVDNNQEYVTANGPLTICNGDSIELTLTNGSDYQWSTGDITQSVFAQSSGNYFATFLSVNGCLKITDTVTVSINPVPEVNLGPDTTLCNTASMTLHAGEGFGAYQWSTGDTTSALLLSTTLPYDSTQYVVTVRDTNGCSANDSVIVVFDICSEVNDVIGSGSISAIFPNPVESGSAVKILMKDIKAYKLNIYDVYGKVLNHLEVHGKEISLEMPYSAGVYMVSIFDSTSREVFVRRLIVE